MPEHCKHCGERIVPDRGFWVHASAVHEPKMNYYRGHNAQPAPHGGHNPPQRQGR